MRARKSGIKMIPGTKIRHHANYVLIKAPKEYRRLTEEERRLIREVLKKEYRRRTAKPKPHTQR